MKIEIINKRNYQVTDKLKDVIIKKVSKLDKYFDEDTPCKVYLKSEGDRNKMEIQLALGKTFLTAEATAQNMYDAVDLVLPKIEKQVIKHKTRLIDKLKKNAFKESEYLFGETDTGKQERLVKVKEFTLSPMSLEEAMYQMDLSGHEFYVFLDEESNTTKVLYRRFDNDYGIIVTK